MRIGPARAEAWSVPAPGVHAAPINFPLNRGGRFCAESGSAVSGPGRTGSHEGRDDFRFQYVSTASVVADLRSEGLCTMAPDLSHRGRGRTWRSEEHTSELQSLMRISYAVFCLKKKTHTQTTH